MSAIHMLTNLSLQFNGYMGRHRRSATVLLLIIAIILTALASRNVSLQDAIRTTGQL